MLGGVSELLAGADKALVIVVTKKDGVAKLKGRVLSLDVPTRSMILTCGEMLLNVNELFDKNEPNSSTPSAESVIH